jgi:hypothetical protein
MSFETYTLHVVAPLEPYEGDQYNELVDEDAWSLVIQNIYKIAGHKEDYINPTTNGDLSWRSVKYYDTDWEDSMRGGILISTDYSQGGACIHPSKRKKNNLAPISMMGQIQ